ncbi:MAG: hypothetical protein D6754_05280 [Alphaproteobacteria bacterium]|nr:MAG: hypothetical protein D6754_05280 [Alphaproteobacteria bacterium]
MLATIEIGTCVSVQGDLVGRLPDGRLSVMVGDRIFTGRAPNPTEDSPTSMRREDEMRSVA